MHRIAEEGIAAHWAYKEGSGALKQGRREVRLAAPADGVAAGPEGPQGVPGDGEGRPLHRRGLRLHPAGRREEPAARRHPRGLRLRVHTDVGERCVGAKVNGKIVPLRYRLKNGDTVEILTSPTAHPSKDWLTYVKTAEAMRARYADRGVDLRLSMLV